ncbi:MAG: SsrA-binding protein SmpB [Planctomycetota bacterium]|jgi:SsrA-binding protein
MTEKTTVVRNRRAFHNYEILERFEAGLALVGPEVKSLRAGKVSIAESFASFRNGELFIVQMHIPEYTHQGYAPHDPLRARKLLLHRRELHKLEEATARKGLTIVPLELYFKNGRAKLEIGLARGRQYHDKRQKMKEQVAKREARAAEGKR